MFLSSTYTSETVMSSSTELDDILENVKSYITTVPEVHHSEGRSEMLPEIPCYTVVLKINGIPGKYD